MEEKEIHLKDYLKVIIKRRLIIMSFFIIVFTAVLLKTMSSVPVYTASSKLLIQKNVQRNIIGYTVSSYDPDFYGTQYQIIKSISVGRRVVKNLDLDNTYQRYMPVKSENDTITSSLKNWIQGLYNKFLIFINIRSEVKIDQNSQDNTLMVDQELFAKAEEISKSEQLAVMISNTINVAPVPESHAVNLSYTAVNPVLAQMIVNSVANAYIEELLAMKMNASEHAIKWMSEKAEDERIKLDQSETKLQEYIRQNNIITIRDQMALEPEKIQKLSSKLTTEDARQTELTNVYNKIKSGSIEDAETIPVIASSDTLKNIRQQIIRAEQNILELSKKYGKKHPLMKKAVADLHILKQKKTQDIIRSIKTVKNELDLVKANVKNLRTFLTVAKTEMHNKNEKFIQYNILKREVESNAFIYDALVKKIKERSVTDQEKIADVLILSKARTPFSPSNNRKQRNILLGALFGLFGGIALVFFIEYLDNTIKSVDEAEVKLGIPVLGAVPLLKTKDKNIDKIVLEEPLSVLSENYKSIRTSILLSRTDNPPKSILVTSMVQSDGKSATSINLAISIASMNKKVLLIDADLRRSRIHKIFHLNNSFGLSTYLAGISKMNIIQKTGVENLRVITAGPTPPNPSELLSSHKMESMIKYCEEKYEIIIIDSSPILPVTDSLIVSKLIDGTIIIIKEGKTTYELIKKGIKSLKDINSTVLGVIINFANVKRGDYYYRDDYYYASDIADNWPDE